MSCTLLPLQISLCHRHSEVSILTSQVVRFIWPCVFNKSVRSSEVFNLSRSMPNICSWFKTIFNICYLLKIYNCSTAVTHLVKYIRKKKGYIFNSQKHLKYVSDFGYEVIITINDLVFSKSILFIVNSILISNNRLQKCWSRIWLLFMNVCVGQIPECPISDNFLMGHS